MTPEWLTQILQSAGFQDALVQDYEVHRIGVNTGFASDIYRLNLTCQPGLS
ncbi:hypothetical protein Pan153_38380 [Gimesia panareensis]|uniref:Uncharacterized protein n=1 Tax=Gimesia panareensis TaxID=2527978 RepID=A0A518FS98_9PLAN|nr:hypothetical protein [Gimesia panareensis]QDV19175.1 hypothetical protein Pan153_38380 [Gimesia panareensis]